MMICACPDQHIEFYHAEIRRARKSHRCDECAHDIQPGERYEHVRGKWEGDPGTYRTCELCLDLRTWMKNQVPCFCWTHGGTIQDAVDCLDELYAISDREEIVGVKFTFLRRYYYPIKKRRLEARGKRQGVGDRHTTA